MEPTDQPPPTPQTWAETSAWAPEPADAAPGPVAWSPAPLAVQSGPQAQDFVRSSSAPGMAPRTRRRLGPTWSVVLAAVLTELVVIALGCNSWVGGKVRDYWEKAPGGLLHQIVESTQIFGWRVSAQSSDTTNAYPASWVMIAVVLIGTGLLVALVARRAGFWQAGGAAFLSVVFASFVAAFLSSLLRTDSLSGVSTCVNSPSSCTVTYTVNPNHNSVKEALFGGATGPNGKVLVGGVLLGIIVALVVGVVASIVQPDDEVRPAAAPLTPEAPRPAFFPPGELQRGYEAAATPPPLAAPGAFTPRSDDESGGRHSRE